MKKNKKTQEKKTFKEWLIDNAKALLWALLIAFGVRSCAFEPFNIPSGSMIPSLLVGDYLFVNKASYGYSRHSFPFSLPVVPKGRVFYSEPERGDVVVFRLPSDTSVDYIKRVIGLPHDKIQVINGVLHINGEPVKRTFVEMVKDKDAQGRDVIYTRYDEELPNGVVHPIWEFSDDMPQDNTVEFIVPEGHFFMMGDNRDNSQDSRWLEQVGYVPKENLVGKAWFIFYSNNGYSPFLFFWNWGKSIRWERLFSKIEP